MSKPNISENWFADFYTGATLDLWRKAIPLEQTQEEIEFICEYLQVFENCKLLDVPCGNGRLTIPLGILEFEVYGLDFNNEFVEEAKKSAIASEVNCQFQQGDMRDLPWKNEFDGAFCMGNSFGYFDRAGSAKFLDSISKALKPNGRFILETEMVAESFLVNGAEKEWTQVGKTFMLVENKFDCRTSSLETDFTFITDGISESRKAKHWIYSTGELCLMLEKAGFEILELFSSTESDPYVLGSDKLLLVAEKTAN